MQIDLLAFNILILFIEYSAGSPHLSAVRLASGHQAFHCILQTRAQDELRFGNVGKEINSVSTNERGASGAQPAILRRKQQQQICRQKVCSLILSADHTHRNGFRNAPTRCLGQQPALQRLFRKHPLHRGQGQQAKACLMFQKGR